MRFAACVCWQGAHSTASATSAVSTDDRARNLNGLTPPMKEGGVESSRSISISRRGQPMATGINPLANAIDVHATKGSKKVRHLAMVPPWCH